MQDVILMLLKANDFGHQRQRVIRITQMAQLTNPHAGHHGFEQCAGDLSHTATNLNQPTLLDDVLHLIGDVFEGEVHGRLGSGADHHSKEKHL